MEGRLVRDFCDEKSAGECEEDWSLARDHSHVFVRLHDLFDASQRQLLLLEVVQLLRVLVNLFPNFQVLLLELLQVFLHFLVYFWGLMVSLVGAECLGHARTGDNVGKRPSVLRLLHGVDVADAKLGRTVQTCIRFHLLLLLLLQLVPAVLLIELWLLLLLKMLLLLVEEPPGERLLSHDLLLRLLGQELKDRRLGPLLKLRRLHLRLHAGVKLLIRRLLLGFLLR